MNNTKGLIALEELKDEMLPSYALDLDDDGYENWVMELYETIKQDLVNYEVLKEEHNKVIESTYELSKTYEKINKELEEDNENLRNELECLQTELKRYRNLEQELGIDLITLIKALKEGIYYKYYYNSIIYHISSLSFNGLRKEYGFWADDHKVLEGLFIHFSSYGKTWALTREELENGKEN